MSSRRTGTAALRAALRQQGVVVNAKKVRRLMREHDLQPRRRRRFVATTDSAHDLPVFPNLAPEVAADGPNQLWLADLERHEALTNRAVMKGHRRVPVAAGIMKLGAA